MLKPDPDWFESLDRVSPEPGAMAAHRDAWPVIVHRYHGVLTDEALAIFHQNTLADLRKERPHVIVIDLRWLEGTTASQRRVSPSSWSSTAT